MCGLVGVAGDVLVRTRDKVFRDMLDVCQVRGRDSTGVIKIDVDGDVDWVKQLGPPTYLCDSRQYEKRIGTGLAGALIGHCRHKTVGDVNVKSAHPFESEHICGVHNGTLRAYGKLDGYSYDKVDSEVLYEHLSKNGPEETFNQIEGAWACVWWDDKEKTLNFIRNDQRTLWFTWSKDLRRMYWASEIWMFGAVERTEELWDGGEDKKKYVPLPTNTLWRFTLNPKATSQEKPLAMKPIRVIEPKKTEVRSYQGNWAARNSGSASASDDWEMGPGGVWRRKGAPAKEAGQQKVQTPFVPDNKEQLNDPLPNHLKKESTQDDGTTTPISAVAYLKHSLNSSDSQTGSTQSQSSRRNILSLPNLSSKSSDQTNKGGSLGNSGKSCLTLSPPQRTNVSFRSVAGVQYITNNLTKDEYEVTQFEKNTNCVCSFCKEPIGDLSEVHTIYKEGEAFVCVSCSRESVAN